MNNYSEAWSDYRKLRNQALIVSLGFLPGLITLRWLIASVFSQGIGTYLFVLLVIVWILGIFAAGARLQAWNCPRCGEPFAWKWWYNKGIFARKCAHCGLPKYANSELAEKLT
jgi:Zn ribbon nucleic-acid-binding protein